jgi:hypothetical protein
MPVGVEGGCVVLVQANDTVRVRGHRSLPSLARPRRAADGERGRSPRPCGRVDASQHVASAWACTERYPAKRCRYAEDSCRPSPGPDRAGWQRSRCLVLGAPDLWRATGPDLRSRKR